MVTSLFHLTPERSRRQRQLGQMLSDVGYRAGFVQTKEMK